MISAIRTIGILFFALAAGCAGLKEVPPSVTAQPVIADPSPVGPNRDGAVAAEPPRPEAIQEVVALAPPPAEPRQPAMTGDEATWFEPVAGSPTPPTVPSKRSQSAAKAAPPPAKATPASPVAVAQPRKKEDPPPIARKLEPPLDVAALKARLRDTNAIGVFTKLALKNQVDDLLNQFRAHYESGKKTSVASLRQPYEMLVLKVLALIQDSDPPLARTIAGSREAIWGILADPEKFNSAI